MSSELLDLTDSLLNAETVSLSLHQLQFGSEPPPADFENQEDLRSLLADPGSDISMRL